MIATPCLNRQQLNDLGQWTSDEELPVSDHPEVCWQFQRVAAAGRGRRRWQCRVLLVLAGTLYLLAGGDQFDC